MTTGVACPTPILRFCDNAGNPAVGGSVLTQVGGVNTPTYSDVNLTQTLPNPIPLNSRGEIANASGTSSQLFLTPNTVYTFTLYDANGNQLNQAAYVNGVQLSITQALIGQTLWPQTVAEAAASVVPTNYFYPPLDIRRYGADPSGVSASDTALAAAISVCGATGGRIRLPGGGTNTGTGSADSIYTFANQYNLDAKTSIIFEGDSGVTAGAQGATLVKYTGTTSPWFIWDSAKGIEFRNLQIETTNAGFTGTLIRCNNDGTNGDPAFCGVFDCTFSAAAGVTYLDLNKCIEFTVDGNNFSGGNPAISATAAGNYANGIWIRRNQFVSSVSPPIQASNAASWVINGNIFEALSTGAPGAIGGLSGAAFGGSAIEINGNWFGDENATVGAWIYIAGAGAAIKNNVFGGNTSGTTGISVAATQGIEITGNSFVNCLTCINFSTSPCRGVIAKSNVASGCTNTYLNTSNVTLGQFDFAIGFGFGIPSGHGATGPNGYRVYTDGSIEQWGTASTLANGNNTVAFPISFPTQCNQVVANYVVNVNATATLKISSVTAANFVVALNDSTATTDEIYWRAVGF